MHACMVGWMVDMSVRCKDTLHGAVQAYLNPTRANPWHLAGVQPYRRETVQEVGRQDQERREGDL